ncbi:MAG: hypothetical protein R2878_04705 [Thermoleophilia bacterium]
MRLSHDHPLLTDGALAAWNGGVTQLCSALTAGPVLRHVAGRRLTMRVDGPDGPLLLKVFARPRARGNARRLDAFARSAAAPFVPRAIATDDSGHVGLIKWTPGTPLDSLDADAVIDGSRDRPRRPHPPRKGAGSIATGRSATSCTSCGAGRYPPPSRWSTRSSRPRTSLPLDSNPW